jgi:hypothetical protein
MAMAARTTAVVSFAICFNFGDRLSDYHDGYSDVAQDYAKAREAHPVNGTTTTSTCSLTALSSAGSSTPPRLSERHGCGRSHLPITRTARRRMGGNRP